ncbi:hypothetical protein D3C86_1534110 [compost metagenome]
MKCSAAIALAVAVLFAAGEAAACSPLRKSPEEWEAFYAEGRAKLIAASRLVYWAQLYAVEDGRNYRRYTVSKGETLYGYYPPESLQSPDRLMGACGPDPRYLIESVNPNSSVGTNVLVFLGTTPGGGLEIIEIAPEGLPLTNTLLEMLQPKIYSQNH